MLQAAQSDKKTTGLWLFKLDNVPAYCQGESIPQKTMERYLQLIRVKRSSFEYSLKELTNLCLHGVDCPYLRFKTTTCPLGGTKTIKRLSYTGLSMTPHIFPFAKILSQHGQHGWNIIGVSGNEHCLASIVFQNRIQKRLEFFVSLVCVNLRGDSLCFCHRASSVFCTDRIRRKNYINLYILDAHARSFALLAPASVSGILSFDRSSSACRTNMIVVVSLSCARQKKAGKNSVTNTDKTNILLIFMVTSLLLK